MVKKLKKTYETPNRAWDEDRIEEEDYLAEEYGLRNKKEIYKAYSELRSFRRQARRLIDEDSEEGEKVLARAHRLGLVREDADLTDLLTLDVEDILARRLQSAVARRGYAESPLDARQMVVHGRVRVNGETVNVPGYLLTQEEEQNLEIVQTEDEEGEEE